MTTGIAGLDAFFNKLTSQLDIIDRREERLCSDIGEMKNTLKSLSEKLNATSDKVVGCEKDIEYMQKEVDRIKGEITAHIDAHSEIVDQKHLSITREIASVRVETERKIADIRKEADDRMDEKICSSEKSIKLWFYGGGAAIVATIIMYIIKEVYAK